MTKNDQHFAIAKALANLLDNQFKIGNLRIGIEPILGLIPGIGDTFTLLLSLYIVWVGIKMNLPKERIAVMMLNVVIDFVLGVIPIVGDVGDFFYKANLKNIEILSAFRNGKTIIDAEIV